MQTRWFLVFQCAQELSNCCGRRVECSKPLWQLLALLPEDVDTYLPGLWPVVADWLLSCQKESIRRRCGGDVISV